MDNLACYTDFITKMRLKFSSSFCFFFFFSFVLTFFFFLGEWDMAGLNMVVNVNMVCWCGCHEKLILYVAGAFVNGDFLSRVR